MTVHLNEWANLDDVHHATRREAETAQQAEATWLTSEAFVLVDRARNDEGGPPRVFFTAMPSLAPAANVPRNQRPPLSAALTGRCSALQARTVTRPASSAEPGSKISAARRRRLFGSTPLAIRSVAPSAIFSVTPRRTCTSPAMTHVVVLPSERSRAIGPSIT